MFDDFKVGLGLEKAEKTNLIQSPDALFRRNQIKKCQREGKDVSGFELVNAQQYAEQMGMRSNNKRGRQQHEARFP